MSFTAEVKQETAHKVFTKNDERAELSALIQMTSSLSLSSLGMTLAVKIENPTIAKVIYRIVKQRYGVDVDLSVKRKMNLKKNKIYCLRILSHAKEILQDLGIYSARGLLDRPLQAIVQKDSAARAYLAGAFMASGSVNAPQKPNYHLEIKAMNENHAQFLIQLMERFDIHARCIERRNRPIVYIKSAEKIADFLKCIDANESMLSFENIRIERDYTNSLTRVINVEVANEMKTQQAAAKQLADIEIVEKADRMQYQNERIQEAALLRKENPEASLIELCYLAEKRSGTPVSKSGMKHRFVKIHELAEKERA